MTEKLRLFRDGVVDIGEAQTDLLQQRLALETLKAAVTAAGFVPAFVALYGSWGSGKTNIMRASWIRRRAGRGMRPSTKRCCSTPGFRSGPRTRS